MCGLIAATNKNLEATGESRERSARICFSGCAWWRLHLPPLRERMGDIPLLAQEFSARVRQGERQAGDGFHARMRLEMLMNHRWPGNVRELRTAIEHAVVLCRGDRITARDLPPTVRSEAAPTSDPARLLAKNDLTVKEAEKQLIIRALKETKGNRTLAAQKIGMSRAGRFIANCTRIIWKDFNLCRQFRIWFTSSRKRADAGCAFSLWSY